MSAMAKKVSLILTTYNCKENLIKTFKSIDEQDYPNIEVCISDSCSTDGTLEVIKEYAQISKHSVVYKSEKDSGIYDGINRSIQMSSGDYLEIMNDEYTCADAISKLARAIEAADAAESANESASGTGVVNEGVGEQRKDVFGEKQRGVAGAHADLVYKEDDVVRRYWKMGNGSIYSGWMPGHPSLMLKREVYDKYGLYNTSYVCSADYEFMVRFLKDGNKLAYVPETLISMFYGGTSTSTAASYTTSIKEALRALKENGVKGRLLITGLRTLRVLGQFIRGGKKFLQLFCIIAVFLCLFGLFSRIFMYKNEGFYNYHNFNRIEEDSLDVLVLGSSHSMDGIDATGLSERLSEFGGNDWTCFNMSVSGMRIEQILYRYKEVLKTQSPKIVVVETFSYSPALDSEIESIHRRSIDYMPLNKNKVEYIFQNVEADKASYVIPFIKYHSRWKELEKEDFMCFSPEWRYENSDGAGFSAPNKIPFEGEYTDYFENDFSHIDGAMPISAERYEITQELIQLIEENGSKLVFLSIPYKVQTDFTNEMAIETNNYLKQEFVDEEAVFILDMNRLINQLDWGYEYMHDEGHVNNDGREYVHQILCEFLNENKLLEEK